MAYTPKDWQPIETAPEAQDVLVCWADRPHWRPRVLLSMENNKWENEDGHSYRPPTHWMPLPQPPAIPAAAASPGDPPSQKN